MKLRGAMAVAALAWPFATPAAATLADPAPDAPAAVAATAGPEDDDGIRLESRASYRVDPNAGAIHVTMDITVTNTRPDRVTSTSILQSYLPRMPVVAFAEAANFAATRDDGTPLGVELEPTDLSEIVILSVDLSPDVFYQQSQKVHLTYDLPNQPPRSDRLTRVNRAFATVVPLPYGDPGLIHLEVVVPDEFEVSAEGTSPELDRLERDDTVILSAKAITSLDDWDVFVVARNPNRMERRSFKASGLDIEVLAWPGDAEWANFVRSRLTGGLKALDELADLPPPRTPELRILETVAPYLYGYAGWYDSLDRTIEVGDELDAHTVLHELTHLWFNDQVFSQRWIGEGFAEEYSTRALEKMGSAAPKPQAIAPGPGALPLNSWSNPSLLDDLAEQQELFGYNASWSVIRSVSNEIGLKRLGRVLNAAFERNIAYTGDPDPERWLGPVDWRRLLDLLQEVGGSKTAAGLFAAHVVAPDEAALLGPRTAARRRYRALEQAGKGWTPPFEVRQAMGSWNFDEATDLIGRAKKLLGVRDQIARVGARLDLEATASLEKAYETADDLDDAEADAARHLRVARALADADRALNRSDGVWATIGLLGTDAGERVDEGVEQFADGDLDEALDEAEAALHAVDEATSRGQERALKLFAALVLIGTMLWARRAIAHLSQDPAFEVSVRAGFPFRRRPPADAESAPPVEDESAPPDDG